MKRQRVERPTRERAWWPWAALGTLIVIAVGTGMLWWSLGASGGRPRLVVDREVVELGDLRFETPARAVFTLTNGGDGRLEIADDLRVEVVKGC
jgi:hypothetical protein